MQKLIIVAALFASLTSCGQSSSSQQETTSKLDCGPDATVECSFLNMPQNVTSTLNIPVDVGIAKMTITGKVYKSDGITPYPDVLIYVYHTDAKGKYSKNGKETGVQKWHGRHHGWIKTDKNGNYTINSIRPAQYPGNQFAAHVHSTVKEPGKKPYWINDFVFKDDPLVTAAYKASQREAGGDGVVDLKLVNGKWEGRRDILLK